MDYGRPLPYSLSAVIRFLRPLPNSCVLKLSVVRDGDVSVLPHAELDALSACSSEQVPYRPPASASVLLCPFIETLVWVKILACSIFII